ncbi:MAG: SDR family oxidoreductase [Planctomycetota bacterium]
MSDGRRVSLVTGSARGLGLAVAQHLRARGDRAHVVYRTENERAASLRDEFGDAAHRADLLQPADAERLVGEVRERSGRLDHVVHCVGEYVSGPLAECSHTDFVRMWASNAESSFLLFNAAREALRAARGSAVFFGASGLNGLRGRRETAAYAAAKSALLVLVRGWAVEEAPHGVNVNMVSPGLIPHDAAHPDTLDAARQKRVPMGEPGRPADIAEAVAFLSSPAAAHTTGTDLLVTGGWML